MGLTPLGSISEGVPPQERGQRLHQVLSYFTNHCSAKGGPGQFSEKEIRERLAAAIQHVLSDVADNPAWILEKRRWLGDGSSIPGLLTQWLTLEQVRIKDGWKWAAEEIPFERLRAPEWSFTLTGRIDRIDIHPEDGIFLWDYKSGQIPSNRELFTDLVSPQLPAYVAAAQAGLISAVTMLHKYPISSGFIILESPLKVAHKILSPSKSNWDDFLKQWFKSIALLGERLKSGDYRACPYPLSANHSKKKACQYCAYAVLCNHGPVSSK